MPTYRVHAYVTVRIEKVIEADTPEHAVEAMYWASLRSDELHQRFCGDRQDYAEDFSDEFLVDELIEQNGKLVIDYEKSRTFRINEDTEGDLVVTSL